MDTLIKAAGFVLIFVDVYYMHTEKNKLSEYMILYAVAREPADERARNLVW